MAKGPSRRWDDRQVVRGGHAIVTDTFSAPDEASIESLAYSRYTNGNGTPCDPAFWPKGFQNVGNTCYANAALQCLLSTALTHALLDHKAAAIFRRYSSNSSLLEKGPGSVDSGDSPKPTKTKRDSRRKSWDDRRMKEKSRWLTESLKEITVEYTSKPPKPVGESPNSISEWLRPRQPVVDPGTITKHPDRLSQCLRPYQQEDAHEFLRALLGTLTMHGQNKTLSSLFDGLLESAVTCQACGTPSLTRDRYMDLSLDINSDHIHNLSDALNEFAKSEILTGDNKVHCEKCDMKRSSTKELRLATAPSILVCHLKRFAFDEYGEVTRIGKKIQFPLRIEIGDIMSRVNKARPPPYELVAVLVHQGQSCEHGHYIAFVKKNGEWYKCNDSQVTQVDVSMVLEQQAYILLYEVAGMRENHGYPSPHKMKKRRNAKSTVDQEYWLSSLLCGMDASIMKLCCEISSPTPHRQYRSQDDLSTLGESTVESSASRLRRSVSSGHLVHSSGFRNGMHSAPRSTQRFEAANRRTVANDIPLLRRSSITTSEPGAPKIQSPRSSSGNRPRRADRGSLPPRPSSRSKNL